MHAFFARFRLLTIADMTSQLLCRNHGGVSQDRRGVV
jgi:hypothetical protein